LATGLPGWLAGWHAPQGGVGDDSGSGRRLAAAGLVANPGAAVSLPPGPLIPNLLSGKAINSDFVPPVQARVVTKAWARPPFSFCAFSTSRPTFTVVVVVVAWLVFSLPKPSTSPGTWRPTGLLLPHLVTPTSKPVTPRRASISPCSRVGHALELRVCAQNIYKQADSIAPRTIVNVSFSGILSGATRHSSKVAYTSSLYQRLVSGFQDYLAAPNLFHSHGRQLSIPPSTAECRSSRLRWRLEWRGELLAPATAASSHSTQRKRHAEFHHLAHVPRFCSLPKRRRRFPPCRA
jgi:hypothetical protein